MSLKIKMPDGKEITIENKKDWELYEQIFGKLSKSRVTEQQKEETSKIFRETLDLKTLDKLDKKLSHKRYTPKGYIHKKGSLEQKFVEFFKNAAENNMHSVKTKELLNKLGYRSSRDIGGSGTELLRNVASRYGYDYKYGVIDKKHTKFIIAPEPTPIVKKHAGGRRGFVDSRVLEFLDKMNEKKARYFKVKKLLKAIGYKRGNELGGVAYRRITELIKANGYEKARQGVFTRVSTHIEPKQQVIQLAAPEEHVRTYYTPDLFIKKRMVEKYDQIPKEFTLFKVWQLVSDRPYSNYKQAPGTLYIYNAIYYQLRSWVRAGYIRVKSESKYAGGREKTLTLYEKIVDSLKGVDSKEAKYCINNRMKVEGDVKEKLFSDQFFRGNNESEQLIDAMPLISESEMERILNHDTISARGLIGAMSRKGTELTERQAHFLFDWMKENIIYLEAKFRKKIRIEDSVFDDAVIRVC